MHPALAPASRPRLGDIAKRLPAPSERPITLERVGHTPLGATPALLVERIHWTVAAFLSLASVSRQALGLRFGGSPSHERSHAHPAGANNGMRAPG